MEVIYGLNIILVGQFVAPSSNVGEFDSKFCLGVGTRLQCACVLACKPVDLRNSLRVCIMASIRSSPWFLLLWSFGIDFKSSGSGSTDTMPRAFVVTVTKHWLFGGIVLVREARISWLLPLSALSRQRVDSGGWGTLTGATDSFRVYRNRGWAWTEKSNETDFQVDCSYALSL